MINKQKRPKIKAKENNKFSIEMSNFCIGYVMFMLFKLLLSCNVNIFFSLFLVFVAMELNKINVLNKKGGPPSL